MEKLTEGIRLIPTNLFMDVLFLYYLGIKKKKKPHQPGYFHNSILKGYFEMEIRKIEKKNQL